MGIILLLGCGRSPLDRSWHARCDWNAEEYFDDPLVIALCKAIEENDTAEIDRLVAAGADVNALGKGNMTPLLWAYPDNKLERFKRLLEHGADPNVVFESEFNTRQGIRPGDSITHMVCKSSFPGYFEAVFDHGGDPNLVKSGRGMIAATPLFTVITEGGGDWHKIQRLIDLGADLNYISGGEATPPMQATSWGGQYDLALKLLEAGADPSIYKSPDSNSKLVHLLIYEKERRGSLWSPEQKADFERLVEWLEDHGESYDAAKQDVERWHTWSLSRGEFRRNMAAEVAERKRREAREQGQQQAIE
jgi:ankyrin repeat protein